jgi:hypothetical protein
LALPTSTPGWTCVFVSHSMAFIIIFDCLVLCDKPLAPNRAPSQSHLPAFC